jgi:NarL family two-component system response regulator LiaR
MDRIQILLAEDHVLVREGTRELIDHEDDLEVVAEAGDGEEAVRLADAHHPDVILMDVAMPKLNGLEATRQIKAAHPEIAVLVLTAYDDDEYVFAFLEMGAAGYLLKDASAEDLVKAIRAVYAGESVLDPAVTRKVIDYFARGTDSSHRWGAQESVETALTERELEVLKLAAQGMTNREIGGQLSISARTVQVHLSNVFGKLGVGSRTEAVLQAVREGWFSLEDVS